MIFRHSLIYVMSAAANAAVPFILIPFLTRSLGTAEYGTLGTFVAIVNLGSVLVGLSTHGLISVRYFEKDGIYFAASVSSALLVSVVTCLILIPLLYVSSSRIYGLTSIPPNWLWTVLIASWGKFLVSVLLTVVQVARRPMAYASIQLLTTVGTFAMTLSLVIGFNWGWQGYAIAQAVFTLGTAAVTFYVLRDDLKLPAPNYNSVLASLSFGLPLVPHLLAGATMSAIDRFLLVDLLTVDAAGSYFLAFQILSVVTIVATAINQAWVPWLFERLAMTDRPSHEIVRGIYSNWAAVLVLTFAVVAGAPWLVHFLAGESFRTAAAVIPYLAPATACGAMYFFLVNQITFEKRNGLLSCATVAAAGLQVCAGLILIPRLGVYGAAIAASAASIFYFLLIWIISHRLVPLPWGFGR